MRKLTAAFTVPSWLGPVVTTLRAATAVLWAVPTLPGVAVVTPFGWLVLAGSLGAWLLGVRLGWVEPVLAAATGLLALLLCLLFLVGRTALHITVEPVHRRLVVGETTSVAVEATNAAGHRMLPLALEVAVGDTVRTFGVPGLSGNGGTFATTFLIDGRRRGVVAVGPVTSVRGDPLGLLQRRVSWAAATEVFVHPATIRLGPLGVGLLRDLEGRTTNDISMSDLAFHTLREYAHGDDRRYIHWRSSAKVGSAAPGGKFLVRQFQDTRRTHVLVLVDGDTAAYGDADEFETAISVAASVAVRAVADGLDTTAVVSDQWVRREPGRPITAQHILDRCARAQPRSEELASLVARGVRLAPEATYALIVTGRQPTFVRLRRTAAQLPSGVDTTVVRIDPSAPARSVAGSPTRVVTLSCLADAGRMLSAGEPR